MKYKENDKVTIQSQEWYEQNKQQNGFVLFRDGNKVSTFSPGMLKFCGQTFTVGKVVTGSSIYPDHYTFVEDGGAYKWTDEMISGPADANAKTYTSDSAPSVQAVQKPSPKPVEKPNTKPADKPNADPKPAEQPKQVEKPNPAERPAQKEEQKPEQKPAQKPAQKPVEKPETKEQPKPETRKEETQQRPVQPQRPVENRQSYDEPEKEHSDLSAFESFTLLLKPRNGASLSDCTTQAFKIMASNDTFPSAMFTFNGFDITISRK